MEYTPSKALLDVIKERNRQVNVEEHTHANDDQYQSNELIRGSHSYVGHVIARSWTYSESTPEKYQSEEPSEFWPWPDETWKPKSPREDLIRATALLLAELERMDRLSNI